MRAVNATQMTATSAMSKMMRAQVEICFLAISSFFVLIKDFKILALKSRTPHPKMGREGPAVDYTCPEPSEDVDQAKAEGLGEGARGMILAHSPMARNLASGFFPR